MNISATHYQVIIVGAGFAGVAAAKKLAKQHIRTLLIDRNNYQQFQPLLYQVASAQLPPSVVAEPLRETFRKSPSVRVLTANVTAISAENRQVTIESGATFSADSLVISAGAEVNFFGTKGAAEHSYPLYSVADATRLGAALVAELDSLDAASLTHAAAPADVVIVGAGPTGVETAGAIAESIRSVVPRYFGDEIAQQCAVHLVDLGTTVLGPFEKPLQDYTRDHLEEVGVTLHLGTSVKEVRADGVTLSDGTVLQARIVVWAGGLQAQNVVSSSGAKTGRGSRIDVNPDLTVPGFSGVYALGDAANIPDGSGKSLPQLGAVALQAGKWAGENILADLAHRERTPFEYRDKGFMAMVGSMAAVAEVGSHHRQMHGPLAFGAWLAVHDTLLPSSRERRKAVSNWFQDYLTHKRTEFIVGYPGRDA